MKINYNILTQTASLELDPAELKGMADEARERVKIMFVETVAKLRAKGIKATVKDKDKRLRIGYLPEKKAETVKKTSGKSMW
jgi:hypothetical protein